MINHSVYGTYPITDNPAVMYVRNLSLIVVLLLIVIRKVIAEPLGGRAVATIC